MSPANSTGPPLSVTSSTVWPGVWPPRLTDLHCAVAEHIVVAVALDEGGARGFEPLVGGELLGVGARFRAEHVVALVPVDDPRRVGEQVGVADVIGVGVRHGEQLDVLRLHADLGELRARCAGKCIVERVVRQPLWHCGHRFGEAGVPQQVPAEMADEIARVDQIPGLPVIGMVVGEWPGVRGQSLSRCLCK
jgi:hypothetical protein